MPPENRFPKIFPIPIFPCFCQQFSPHTFSNTYVGKKMQSQSSERLYQKEYKIHLFSPLNRKAKPTQLVTISIIGKTKVYFPRVGGVQVHNDCPPVILNVVRLQKRKISVLWLNTSLNWNTFNKLSTRRQYNGKLNQVLQICKGCKKLMIWLAPTNIGREKKRWTVLLGRNYWFSAFEGKKPDFRAKQICDETIPSSLWGREKKQHFSNA